MAGSDWTLVETDVWRGPDADPAREETQADATATAVVFEAVVGLPGRFLASLIEADSLLLHADLLNSYLLDWTPCWARKGIG